MASYALEGLVTDQNFDEGAYLLANPDVSNAVRSGEVESGLVHFQLLGRHEERRMRFPTSLISEAKKRKLSDIKSILRADLKSVETDSCYDFLSESLRTQFNIIDTDSVSSNGYDQYAMKLIEDNKDGFVLDCGAGKRPVYFDNVINFEIADYDSTDVRGVGEVLPFIDDSFDAVLSLAVLEHVKDPFLCAREIARVLKPGGSLMCCVPFLQPVHGYPHHYYNMTSQGLQNLFSDYLDINEVKVYESISPIWSLTWILQSWVAGLKGQAKDDFMQMKVSDFMGSPGKYLEEAFVKELSTEKNLELASATVLFARKPIKE